MFFQIRLVFIVFAVDAVSKSNDELRLKRAVDNQAPQGKCLSFILDGQAIEYVCCNNCFESNEHCLGRVYPLMSWNNYYCNSCGRSRLSSARKTSEPFFCGGCYGQTRKGQTCCKKYGNIPFGCWLLRACFETLCRSDGIQQSKNLNPLVIHGVETKPDENARYMGPFDNARFRPPDENARFSPHTVSKVPVCFDGVCNVEEHESCPADCCAIRNPEKCAVAQGSCPPECCGESSCCVEKESKNMLNMVAMCVTPPFGCICIACILYRYYSNKKRIRVGDQRIHPQKIAWAPNGQFAY